MSVFEITRRHQSLATTRRNALWDVEALPAFTVLGLALLRIEEIEPAQYDPTDVYWAIRFAADQKPEPMQRAMNTLRAAVELEHGPECKPSDFTKSQHQARLLLATGARYALLLAAGIAASDAA